MQLWFLPQCRLTAFFFVRSIQQAWYDTCILTSAYDNLFIRLIQQVRFDTCILTQAYELLFIRPKQQA